MKNLILLFLMISSGWAKPVYELLDLQSHITMHHAYSFFSDGTQNATEEEIAELKYKHLLKNIQFKNLLAKNPGSRIISHGAIAFEYASDKEEIKKTIMDEIKAINEMAAKDPENFVVAKSPEEVRKYAHETDKTIIIHSIEGANHILDSQEDANFWAKQGVAFVTLIHLLDDEHGGAAHNPDVIGKIINLKGTLRKLHKSKYRGLTAKGKDAIRWLARAGIMTDLTHMSPESVKDALDVFKELKLPPLITHSLYWPIHKNDRAVTHEQLLDVYKMGGLFSLPISGFSVVPDKPDQSFLDFVKGQNVCENSIDAYRVSFQFVEKALLKSLYGKDWDELSEEEKINGSIGWQSDFNGWLNHSRPRYGKEGCKEIPANARLPEIEVKGLAHPGLLPQYWNALEREGMNVDSLKKSTEKFLRMWEQFQKYKK